MDKSLTTAHEWSITGLVTDLLHARWDDEPPGSAQACRMAEDLAKQLWQANTHERSRCRRQIERYYGMSLDPAMQIASMILRDDIPLVWNLTRSFIGTVVSHVAAAVDPKIQFVTSNADWQTQRKAKKLDQFVEALALQPAPPFSNVSELRTAVFRDACLFRRGAAQVSADADNGCVLTERVLPWELLADRRDARYNNPAELCRCYPMSRHVLRDWFPERSDDIDKATNATAIELELEFGFDSSNVRISQDHVQVYEIWVNATNPETKGRHIMVLEGITPALIDEEYNLPYPPFAFVYWDHPIIGGTSQSLADEIAPIEDEVNRTVQRLADSARRTSLNVIFKKAGSIEDAALEDTKDAITIEYTGDMPPTMVQAQAVNPSMVQWIELQKDVANDICGISEMAQTGSREPNMPSAAAQRAVSAEQSKRLAWLSRQLENWQVRWAQLTIHAVRTIADKKPNFAARWPGAGFLRSIEWKDVDLNDDQYVIQTYPVGESKGRPEDRLQRAEEAFTKGMISLSTYQAIVEGTEDYAAETREQSVQRELIEQYIDNWLDATDEQMASNMLDEKRGQMLVPPPIKYLNLADGILQVALAYLQAELDGVPDANRKLFLNWLEMADSELQKQLEREAILKAKTMQRPPTANPAPAPIPVPGAPQ
jgi:hypothetical protein